MFKLNFSMNREMQKAINPNFAMRGMQQGISAIGKGLVKRAKQGIKNPPKTGRTYIINGRAHQASKAGQYPANRTGKLMNSVAMVSGGLDMTFGAGAEYAPYLQQFPTAQVRTSSWKKIAPRPFLTLAHDEEEPKFIEKMEASFTKVTGFK